MTRGQLNCLGVNCQAIVTQNACQDSCKSLSSQDMSHPVDVPRVVRTLLAYHGKNQADLAPVLGFSIPQISKLLNGSREWSVDEVFKLAAFFDVPYTLFLEDPATLVRNRWLLRPTLVSA